MKNFLKIVAAFLLLASMVALVGCRVDKTDEKPSERLSYDDVVLADCVRLGAYEGLTVMLSSQDADRGEAVWEAVRNGSEILQYPEDAVAYYVAQAEARCRYYATENGVDEAAAMAALGTSREEMAADAKRLVAEDLIVLAVQADAGIVLTEDEKTRLFDKYVDKYVADFGYDRAYVAENLADLVYESMLYDKTTEYLILKNTFVK